RASRRRASTRRRNAERGECAVSGALHAGERAVRHDERRGAGEPAIGGATVCRVVAAAGGGNVRNSGRKRRIRSAGGAGGHETNRAVFWFRFGRAEKQI